MKLIDKDALVAEIKKRKNFNETLNAHSRLDECNAIFSFIDTLEVKEVDLEKEIKKIQRDYKTIDEYEGYFATIYASDIEWVAKHFFELGLKVQKNEPVSDDLQEEITRYFSKNPIKTLTDWPVLKNTALHFANWQKEQKNIWHTMDETPNYPCDILFLTDVDNMFLYRYMENGRPVDKETPYFHNILKGKCWCYCNDIINK